MFDMQPVLLCCTCLFTLKTIQQGTLSSIPEFTHQFYKWRTSYIGGFLAVISLAMLPLNFGVAWVASFVSDRKLLLWSWSSVTLGLVLMLSFNGLAPVKGIYLSGVVLVVSSGFNRC